jgi:hypothetical protein
MEKTPFDVLPLATRVSINIVRLALTESERENRIFENHSITFSAKEKDFPKFLV